MKIVKMFRWAKYLLIILFFPFQLVFAQKKGIPGKCIMVFGSHADDVEEIAGGTFAKYIAKGYQGVYVCVMNNISGEQLEKIPGNWDYKRHKPTLTLTASPKTYPVGAIESNQIRTEEGLAAAKAFNAIPIFLNFGEPELWMGRKLIIYGTRDFIDYDPPGRQEVAIATRYSKDVNVVVDILKKYKPEITITHTLGGEKLDHRASAYLVYLAYVKAMDQGVPLGKLWMPVYGWLASDYSQKNGRGKPDVIINIQKYIETKNEAWNKHVSQNGGDVDKYFLPRHPEYDQKRERFITVIDNTK